MPGCPQIRSRDFRKVRFLPRCRHAADRKRLAFRLRGNGPLGKGKIMTLSDVMTSASAPSAPRLRRPSWRDPRLLIGLLLLFGSLAIGSRLVAVADDSVPVFAARAEMPTGTALSSDVLEVVRLRLTGSSAAYLDARRPIPQGMVMIRPVGAGEIVPVTALASADHLLQRPVSLPLQGPAPAGLTAGGLVDVWAATKRRDALGGGYDDPERIADMVEVFDVDAAGSGLTADHSGSVEVLLPAQTLPSVLGALANDARVTILPVLGSGHGTADGKDAA
jgi:hypothetical protein